MSLTRPVRIGSICAFAGAAVLAAMFAAGLRAGQSLAALDLPSTPEAYTAAIRPGAGAILRVIALDNLFVIAYLGTFLGAAALTWKRVRLIPAIGLGFALLLAVLDWTENAATVHAARAALAGVPVADWQITSLSVIGQVKYASATVAVAAFAAALADRRPFTVAVTALYLLFPLVNAIAVVAPSAALLVVIWMWAMLAVSGVFLWRRAAEADYTPRGHFLRFRRRLEIGG